MTTSANIFVKQSNLTMPPPGWLHVNGVSLSTDVHQYEQLLQTYDHRIKQTGSPIPLSTPSVMSPPASVPFTMTMVEGQRNNRQYQKLENVDLPKKIFIDRQIKKAKSLPGLIKGTALSHRTSLHSASYINQAAPPNQSTNNNPEDSLPVVVNDNDEDSLPVSEQIERTHESRRPRVYFADYNKVQIYEDNNEESQPNNTHRRHRHRSSKKSAALIPSSHVSPPSIQHSQSLYTPYRPLSRQQHQAGYELNIKKQHLTASPRVHSSRITHLPDILNQSLSNDIVIHERYPLQREKPLVRFPDSAFEIPMNSSNEISRESTRAGGIRPSAIQDYNDQNYRLESSGGDAGINTLFKSGSMSSSSTSRHRPQLRTISLRQQFNSPIKIKPTSISNNYQTVPNPRRSASLKHSNARINSVDDDNEDMHHNGSLLPLENQPMTGMNSSKQLKRNYVIHFNSRNGNTLIDSNESSNRHFHEASQDRFENSLKVVRPPYMTNNIAPNHEPQIMNGNVLSTRMNSRGGSREYHVASNTIFV